MRTIRFGLGSRLLLCILLALSAAVRAQGVEADLVLLNGKVWTVDPAQPEAQAVAVWQGRILAVGSDAEVGALVGSRTQVLDVGGKLVLPGFNDNHVHLKTGGLWMAGPQLKDAGDAEEMGRRLAEKAKELPPGAWITGGTWDHDNWPDGRLPTAEMVDRYVPDRPVLVQRYDGHMSVANSLALRLAGITAETPDPEGGIIVRKAGSQEPEGVLKDMAQQLVRAVIPPPSEATIQHAIETSLAECRRVGLTSVTEMNLDPTTLRIYQRLLAEGRLTTRIDGRWTLSEWQRLADLGLRRDFRNQNWIKIGGLKGFSDGSLGSSTARFFEPYVHEPNHRGVYETPPAELEQLVLAADRAGLHIAVHAIGDEANSVLLDIFAKAMDQNGPGDRRFRMEHAQHIHPKDYARFADLGVIASVQPYHAIDDGRWAEGRIGRERSAHTYPFRSFLDAGAPLTFGSDFPVAPLNPILGIDAAVTRRTTDGANPEGWFPEQKITVQEAIAAYTIAPAFASFDEALKGSITPGKLADLVVLSRDLLSIPPNEISGTEVVYTIVGGRVVHQAP